MAANRGLYGQAEGNEKRSQTEWLSDRMDENHLVEGEWLGRMINCAKDGNMKGMALVRDQMRAAYIRGKVPPNLAQERADSCLRQAGIHLKV